MTDNFNRELESVKNNQIEVLKLNNTITELKKSIAKLDVAEKRISKLEDRSVDNIQVEAQREKKWDIAGKILNPCGKNRLRVEI